MKSSKARVIAVMMLSPAVVLLIGSGACGGAVSLEDPVGSGLGSGSGGNTSCEALAECCSDNVGISLGCRGALARNVPSECADLLTQLEETGQCGGGTTGQSDGGVIFGDTGVTEFDAGFTDASGGADVGCGECFDGGCFSCGADAGATSDAGFFDGPVIFDGQVFDGQVFDGQVFDGQVFDGQVFDGGGTDAGFVDAATPCQDLAVCCSEPNFPPARLSNCQYFAQEGAESLCTSVLMLYSQQGFCQ